MSSFFEHRAARNEALFRSVNEEIEKLGLATESKPEERRIGFVCECSNDSCMETVQLTVPEYEQVRSGSRWFAILPDHVTEEIEHVVQAHPHYVIVQKDTPRWGTHLRGHRPPRLIGQSIGQSPGRVSYRPKVAA